MVELDMTRLLTRNRIMIMVSIYMKEGDRQFVKQTQIIRQYNELDIKKSYTRPYIMKVLKEFEKENFLTSKKIGRHKLFKINENFELLFLKAYEFFEELVL